MTARILLPLIAIIQFMACGNAAPSSQDQDAQITQNVQAEEFHRLLEEKGGQVLDVRTSAELEGGYIPEAIHMDFYSNSFQQELEKLEKDKPVFVYCAAGGRSGNAMKIMQGMGFKEVYNLSGGFPTWQSAGYDVQK